MIGGPSQGKSSWLSTDNSVLKHSPAEADRRFQLGRFQVAGTVPVKTYQSNTQQLKHVIIDPAMISDAGDKASHHKASPGKAGKHRPSHQQPCNRAMQTLRQK